MTKKLIEVALPLEKINAESAREKSIRHGHPSTLHLWWARRPLAAARAVIWSSLVDDPSSHPDLFPTEEDQNKERQRLFRILEELVLWDNSNNDAVLNAAKEEILKSTNGVFPEFLDPFAGGGAIPLEALRLGLKTNAHDLNPVAVMINKAMIEIPSRFSGFAPVNPESHKQISLGSDWVAANGLADDVHYYGSLMRDEAYKQIGHLYPKIAVPKEYGGGDATVIAWIWARTVKCPNPACHCNTPLVKTFNLSNKKGRGISVAYDGDTPHFTVVDGDKKIFPGTVNRKGAVCKKCGSPISYPYIREESKNGRLGMRLTAVVAESRGGRLYLSPDSSHEFVANVHIEDPIILGPLAYYPGYVNPVAYGLENIEDLFSKRQINSINVFSMLVKTLQSIAEKDAINAGLPDDHISLSQGGTGARAYGEAIATYLAFCVDRLADKMSTLCVWDTTRDGVGHTFGMTGMPMLWDYAEANPFSNSSGCFDNMVMWVESYIRNSPKNEALGLACQHDAQTDAHFRDIMVSTDPPYYSNVPYADFSDFFYVWLRRSIGHIYPDLFGTMLTPKAEELVADPYRHGGKEEAASHFESGMLETCKHLYSYSSDDIPVTIYYAFKQSDGDTSSKDGANTGWEKMLTAIISAGFSITGTWPMRTELANRMRANESNALASSIVLVCRKRPADAPQTTRRNLINALRRDLRPALKKLQESNIAPVDLAQSAIGPGMAVFSRYRQVLEADGKPMPVRSALQVINEEIDLYFNEQVGDLDAASRFCVDLYTQNAYNDMKYGDAEVLANAKGTSIPMMVSHGVLYAKAGNAHLIERAEMPTKVDSNESNIWMLTQQLTQAMSTGGIEACAQIICSMFGSNAERAKDLAYRLYTIAEKKGWANEAYAYNSLVVAWPDIQTRAAAMKLETPEQISMFE